jgi:large conductance mechanosensitive channel
VWKEFREFALRGNVVDMAVGIIIGAAFGKVVSTLVDNVLMPPIGQLLGNVDFSSLFLNLSGTHYPTLGAAREAGAATLTYGIFINALVNFAIVSFALFLVVRTMNAVRSRASAPEAPAAAPPPPPDVVLLGEIRDLLAARR